MDFESILLGMTPFDIVQAIIASATILVAVEFAVFATDQIVAMFGGGERE